MTGQEALNHLVSGDSEDSDPESAISLDVSGAGHDVEFG